MKGFIIKASLLKQDYNLYINVLLNKYKSNNKFFLKRLRKDILKKKSVFKRCSKKHSWANQTYIQRHHLSNLGVDRQNMFKHERN